MPWGGFVKRKTAFNNDWLNQGTFYNLTFLFLFKIIHKRKLTEQLKRKFQRRCWYKSANLNWCLNYKANQNFSQDQIKGTQFNWTYALRVSFMFLFTKKLFPIF